RVQCFFFSSRRRHTRSKRDWSSDVCSSDLEDVDVINNPEDPSAGTRKVPFSRVLYIEQDDFREDPPKKFFRLSPGREVRLRCARSEERRVGKECGSRGARESYKDGRGSEAC